MNNSDNLSQHNDRSTFHEGNTSKTFTVLEGVDNKWLLRFKDSLSHFVGFEGDWSFKFLVTSFLTDLPVDASHSDGRSSSSDEGNGAISSLQFTRVFQNTDLSSEGSDSVDGGISLEYHDITNTRHVFLLQTLDVESTVVTRDGLRDRFVVHFNSEDLSIARSGGSVSGQEDNFFGWSDSSLFDTSSQHITNTLDFVDTGDWGSGRSSGRSLRDGDEFLKDIEESVNVDDCLSLFDVSSVPPGLSTEVHRSEAIPREKGLLDVHINLALF